MSKNVLDYALEKTKAYMIKLGMRNYFYTQLEKIISMHEHGKFIKFDFGTTKERYYFEYYCQRYHLPNTILSQQCNQLNPNPVFKYNTKIEEKQKELKAFDEEIKKLSAIRQKLLEANNKIPAGNQHPVEYMSNYLSNITKFVQERHNKTKIELEMFERYKKNIFNASKTFKECERMFLKIIIPYFIKQVEYGMKKLFGTNRLYVKYPKKEVIRDFYEKRTRYAYNFDSKWSIFEKEIISYLKNYVSREMTIVFVRKNEEISLKVSENTCFKVIKDNAETIKQRNELEQRYAQFLAQNPLFEALIAVRTTAYNTLEQTKKQVMTFSESLIAHYCSHEVVQQYNQFIEDFAELNKTIPQKQWDRFASFPLKDLGDIFPNVYLEIIEQPNKALEFLPSQYIPKNAKKNVEVVNKIEGNGWVWTR